MCSKQQATFVLSKDDYRRLKKRSSATDNSEGEDHNSMLTRKEACMKRKAYAWEHEKKNKVEEPTEFETEEKEGAKHLLEKKNRNQLENQQELRYLKELISDAECHATLEKQMLEKRILKTEVEKKEQKVHEEIEVHRQKIVAYEAEREQKRKDNNAMFAKMMLKQIEDSKKKRKLQEEQKEQEVKKLIKEMDELKREEIKNRKSKKLRRKQIHEELLKENQLIIEQKLQQKQLELEEDRKISDYLIEKAETEKAAEEEKKKRRRAQEIELARLRASQERATDLIAEKDSLRAKRNQERAEKEYRQKQKELEQRKKEIETMLKKARAEQIAYRQSTKEADAKREEEEYQRILRVRKEEDERERRRLAEKKKARMSFAEEIKAQIEDREKCAKTERAHARQEHRRWIAERDVVQSKIQDVINSKLEQLKLSEMPEKYVKVVERKLSKSARRLR